MGIAAAAAAAFVVTFARGQNSIELLVRMKRGRRDALLDTVERFGISVPFSVFSAP